MVTLPRYMVKWRCRKAVQRHLCCMSARSAQITERWTAWETGETGEDLLLHVGASSTNHRAMDCMGTGETGEDLVRNTLSIHT